MHRKWNELKFSSKWMNLLGAGTKYGEKTPCESAGMRNHNVNPNPSESVDNALNEPQLKPLTLSKSVGDALYAELSRPFQGFAIDPLDVFRIVAVDANIVCRVKYI